MTIKRKKEKQDPLNAIHAKEMEFVTSVMEMVYCHPGKTAIIAMEVDYAITAMEKDTYIIKN